MIKLNKKDLDTALAQALNNHLGEKPWYEHLGTFPDLESVIILCKERGLRLKGYHISCLTMNKQSDNDILCVIAGDQVHEYHLGVLNYDISNLKGVGDNLNILLSRYELPTYEWVDSGDAIIAHMLT